MAPEQIQQFIANGGNPGQLAAILGAQQAPAIPHNMNDGNLSALLRAPDPRNSLQSFSHPEGQGLGITGRGQFDGEYAVTLESVSFENSKKGQILKLVMTVDESSNPSITLGSKREHPLFQWVDAVVSETKGVLQMLYEAKGGVGWVPVEVKKVEGEKKEEEDEDKVESNL